MQKLSTDLTNYDSPTAGFSEGKIRDNPGDDTGSGVVAAWGNDVTYALLAIAKKYGLTGAVSDTPESETNSDILDSLERMVGIKAGATIEWSSVTTYGTAGESVLRAGMQFTNVLATGNTNKDPLTQPLYWLAVPEARVLWGQYNSGSIIQGDSHQIHDFNHAQYKPYFSLGVHRFGGYSGYAYQAFGVHLDGSAGGASASEKSDMLQAWFLADTFAPGAEGSRVLKDARGKVIRAVDLAGGQADLIGEVLADQMQGHRHSTGAGATGVGIVVPSDQKSGISAAITTADPVTDGVNGVPRVGTKTRDQSITGGVPYMVIMVAL